MSLSSLRRMPWSITLTLLQDTYDKVTHLLLLLHEVEVEKGSAMVSGDIPCRKIVGSLVREWMESRH